MNSKSVIPFNLLLVGNSGVGKSSILRRFVDEAFTGSTAPTAIKYKKIEIDDEKIFLWISNRESSYSDQDGIFVVYDVTNQASFNNVPEWLNQINKYAKKDVIKFLIGNKIDMNSKRVVDSETAKEFANRNNIQFMETSAKDSSNVENAFRTMAKQIKNIHFPAAAANQQIAMRAPLKSTNKIAQTGDLGQGISRVNDDSGARRKEMIEMKDSLATDAGPSHKYRKVSTKEGTSERRLDNVQRSENVKPSRSRTMVGGANAIIGTIEKKVYKFENKQSKLASKGIPYFCSPYFYSAKNGYKLQLRVQPSYSNNKLDEVVVTLAIVSGEFDKSLQWPCLLSFVISAEDEVNKDKREGETVNYQSAKDRHLNKPNDSELFLYNPVSFLFTGCASCCYSDVESIVVKCEVKK